MYGPLNVSPSALRARVVRYAKSCIEIDTRSLAVFRVFVGVLIVADLLSRSRNFSFYYTDDGAVPQWLAQELSADYAFSVYHLTSDSTVITLLFLVQGLIALQLIVGYKTRIATVLSFLFVVSLDHHNPFVLSYADTLFRLLLFWAVFLPLGERWSVDAVHADREPRSSVANAASALILGQMVYMYVVNGLHKMQSPYWTGGEATPHVFGLTEMTFFLGDLVGSLPTELLVYGGLTWFYMLLFSWVLLLLRGRRRMLLAGMFVSVHASFAVTVRIGGFAYVAIAGLTLFLQSSAWEDGKALLRYLSVDLERLSRPRRRLERAAASVPKASIDSARWRRVRRTSYRTTLLVIVVVIVGVGSVLTLQATVFLDDGLTRGEQIDKIYEEDVAIQQLERAAKAFGVDQPSWSVFAPHPRTTDRYYVFAAETTTGERIDVYNDRPLTYERPGHELQKQYDTYRERFYMNSVRNGGLSYDNDVPVALADHLCETWEGERGERLVRINMHYVGENVTLETRNTPEDREVEYLRTIHRHGCGDTGPEDIDPPTIDSSGTAVVRSSEA